LQYDVKEEIVVKSDILPVDNISVKDEPDNHLETLENLGTLKTLENLETLETLETLEETLYFDNDDWIDSDEPLQVNLFQKYLFLHQLTHSMTKDCPLNYQFRT
jgi:hypothetical protein